MKTQASLLLGLVLMSTSLCVWADIIPTGQRRVSSCFRLANVDQYPNYVFLSYTEDRLDDYYAILRKDACIRFVRQSSTTLYAIPIAQFKEADLKADKLGDDDKRFQRYFNSNPNLIRTGTTLYPHEFISETDSATNVEDILVIKSLTPDTLIVAYESAVYTYADGHTDRRSWDVVKWEEGSDYSGEQAWPEIDKLWLTIGGVAVIGLFVVLYNRNRKR